MTRKNENSIRADGFVSEVAAVKDLGMRIRHIASRLKSMDSEIAVLLIEDLIKGNDMGKPNYGAVYLALIKNRDLTAVFGYELLAEMYAISSEKDLQRAMEFLRGGPVKTNEALVEESALSRKLMHLSLGEKKALARQKDYKHLEFLLHDTDPTVIENLLKNPKITENEVLKIASNRKAPHVVLEEVFKSSKWSSNYRIRKALVFNENTPIDISLNLCSAMMKQDLRQIVKDNKLNEALVKRAKEVISSKS